MEESLCRRHPPQILPWVERPLSQSVVRLEMNRNVTLVKDPNEFFLETPAAEGMSFLPWCVPFCAIKNTMVVHEVHED